VKVPNLMNSLCIHVAGMKVTMFNDQNLALCDEQRALGLPETARPTTISGKSSTPMKRSCPVDTHEVLTSISLISPYYAGRGNSYSCGSTI